MEILKYDPVADEIEILCDCENKSVHDISHIEEVDRVPDMAFFETIEIECSCGRHHFLNLEIPEDDFEELEQETLFLPYTEINSRKQLRDIMFSKRKDLKKKDRKKINEQAKKKKEKKYGKKIEAVREELTAAASIILPKR